MLSYKLIRSNRKTVSLKVVNKEIFVYAPKLYPQSLIDSFVLKHEKWINTKINTNRKILSFDLTNLKEIYILGKSYQLDLSIDNKSEIYLSDDVLFISGKSINVMANKYKKYLEEIITSEIETIQKQTNITFSYSFKYYKSRWGCCYKNKDLIVINSLLGCVKKELIDSVIYHEMAHLKVSNHQKEFYDYLAKFDKDYHQHAKELKNYEIM